jgi:hypothetical protein
MPPESTALCGSMNTTTMAFSPARDITRRPASRPIGPGPAADTNMKLQNTVPAPPATAEALAEQTRSDESPAQAGSLAAQRDALREALPSRNAGEGFKPNGKAQRRKHPAQHGGAHRQGSAHGAQRAQAFAVRQSEEVQIQDDGTEESIALPQELDTAIATWANDAIDQATPSKPAMTRSCPQAPLTSGSPATDAGNSRAAGSTSPQERSPGSRKSSRTTSPRNRARQERTAAAAESVTACKARKASPWPVDHALARGHAQRPAPIGELPRQPRSGARSTARIAPLAAAAPAQRQVDELDSTRVAGKSNSDVLLR